MIQVITLSGSPGVTHVHVPFNKNKTTQYWFLPHLSPQNALCLCTETENIKICSSSQHNIHYWRKMFIEWRNCKCLDVVTDTCTVYNQKMGDSRKYPYYTTGGFLKFKGQWGWPLNWKSMEACHLKQFTMTVSVMLCLEVFEGCFIFYLCFIGLSRPSIKKH